MPTKRSTVFRTNASINAPVAPTGNNSTRRIKPVADAPAKSSAGHAAASETGSGKLNTDVSKALVRKLRLRKPAPSQKRPPEKKEKSALSSKPAPTLLLNLRLTRYEGILDEVAAALGKHKSTVCAGVKRKDPTYLIPVLKLVLARDEAERKRRADLRRLEHEAEQQRLSDESDDSDPDNDD